MLKSHDIAHARLVLLPLAFWGIVIGLSGATHFSIPVLYSPSTPIKVRAAIDNVPTVGQTATVTCTAQTAHDAPNTSVDLRLPAEVQIISGNPRWQGTLFAANPVRLTVSVRAIRPGDIAVTCRAYRQVDPTNSWGDVAAIYLSIGEIQSRMGFPGLDFPLARYLGDGQGSPQLSGTIPNSMRLSSRVPSPPSVSPSRSGGNSGSSRIQTPRSPTGTLTVTGRWRYANREGAYVGANQFLVELVTGSGGHLTWCYTDTSGYYSCGPVSNPGSAGIRTVLLSRVSYSPNGDTLQVVRPGCGTDSSCAYHAQSGSYVFSDGTYDIGTWDLLQGSQSEGANWLKDDLDRAYKFIWYSAGSSQSPQETAGSGTIVWSYDSTDGTYYVTGGQIYLNGEDRLSHDIAIHEYGHNVMYNLYQWWPQAGCPSPHYISAHSAINCAWTEGWADFFPLAVNSDPAFHWASGASMNLETPTWGTAYWDSGEDVEGRVAGALWDLYDSSNEGYDQLYDGFANIWDAFYHQTDHKLLEYWLAWLYRGHNYDQAVMSLYQNTIDFRSAVRNDDIHAPSDIDPASVSMVITQNSANATKSDDDPTLCRGGQGSATIWIRFTPNRGGQFTANTVGSAYDTVLALWSGSRGNLTSIACDDDSGGSLTSALTATLTGGTTYYIEVASYGTTSAGSMVFTANHSSCFDLTTNASPSGRGSVSADPAPNCVSQYASGTSVTLTANPNAGFRHANWSGDATGSTNPVTILMDGNKVVTAEFSTVAGYRRAYDAQHGYDLPGILRRVEGHGSTGDHDVDSVYTFAGDSYSYYLNSHSRSSYDNLGAPITVTAHFGTNFLNARWDGTQAYFGDGITANDIVAHELTHAVTQYTANLEYEWQSGALNESFSDIFAAMVDREDWLIGEELSANLLGGRDALRDMADPKRFGYPDHVNDWRSTCTDYQGVHTNSSIFNKAYFNVATSMGKDKGEKIFYRALTIYLVPTSSFEDARAAVLQSAIDLYLAGSSEWNGVYNGLNAVGLDGNWQPSTNNCSCAASAALTDGETVADQVSALRTITTLYQVRDELMSTGAAGRYYRSLYELQTVRISYLLLLDTSLRSSGSRILLEVTPSLKQLMDGKGNRSSITRDTVDQAVQFLARLANADRARGGGELARTIDEELTRIDRSKLIGMNYDQAWAYLNSVVPGAGNNKVYLPMTSK